MAGWSREKRLKFEAAFYAFLDNCWINSKDYTAPICLGEHLYGGQRFAITQILDALEQDIHIIYFLKSRQLGISTIIRALSIFYLGVHRGLQGALVFDSAPNKENARIELVTMIKDLPARIKFPKIKGTGEGNREGIAFENSSRMLFKSAGVKKSKSSGTLGRSVGLAFAHLCMAPGTPVIVADGRIKKIEDVRVGDRVITHSGAVANVIANTARVNFYPMVKITPWLGQSVVCTPEHKIPTQRGLIAAGTIVKSDLVFMPVRQVTHEQKVSHLPGNLPKHKGRVSAGSEAEITLDEEVGFAVGYYLAEGSICYQRRDEKYYDYPAGITFSRHRNEKHYADRAIAALKPFTTGTRGTVDHKDSLTTTETIYSAALARWFVQHFGSLDDKLIPDKVFTWGQAFCRGLLAGLLCGDGSKTITRAQGHPLNTVRISTTRASIAMQARDLASSLGYGWAGWCEQEAGQRYGRNCKHIWTVMWNGRCAAGLRRLMGLPVVKMCGHTYSEKFSMLHGSVALKIRKIEWVAPTPAVHDLSVDHSDHTFRTPSLAVSNSELCSYENEEGLIAFQESLSDMNPDRLYIYESTARGYNQWEVMWRAAREDPMHVRCVFLGWWSKDTQVIARDHADFKVYGETPPTEKEAEKIKLVRDRYGVQVTPEQLAWVRRKMDPTAKQEGDANPEYEGDSYKIQEQPWIEEEAFQQSGSIFFPALQLTEITQKFVSHKYKTYMFLPGDEFWQMKIYSPAPTTRNIDLKVWEEPDPVDGNYVLGVDPAYGENEHNDRASIQVFRCYADGLDQVAEYATNFHNPRQLAWIIASIMGWYGSGQAQVRYAMELAGGGTACFGEIRNLKHSIDTGFFKAEADARGLNDIFRNVKTFLYSRPDAMHPGQNYHLKTTGQLKVTWLESFRGYVTSRAIHIRSQDLLAEMKTIAREGDTIKAQGVLKDDRVLAAAFAVHCWEQGSRKSLVALRQTREVIAARQRKSIVDQVALFQQNQLLAFFDSKRRQRTNDRMIAMRNNWRRR